MDIGFIYMDPKIVREIANGRLKIISLPKNFQETLIEHYGIQTVFPVAISLLKDIPSSSIVAGITLHSERTPNCIPLPSEVDQKMVRTFYGGYHNGTPVTGHPKRWVCSE